MQKGIISKETKSNVTIITFEDGTFWVLVGEVVEFPAPTVIANEEDDSEEDVTEEDVTEEEEEEEEEEDDSDDSDGEEFWTKEEINDSTRKELVEIITDEELDIDHEEITSLKKLRRTVIKELDL